MEGRVIAKTFDCRNDGQDPTDIGEPVFERERGDDQREYEREYKERKSNDHSPSLWPNEV